MEIIISVIVPTSGRLESLRRLLESLSCAKDRESIAHEVIIANNAANDAAACAVENLVSEFFRRTNDGWKHIREPIPGKCRALNKTIPSARGSIIAFLDDDEEVAGDWLRATYDFFVHYTFDAMQGPILPPPEIQNDEEFQRLYNRYRTINFYNQRSGVVEISTLKGGNMAIRKEMFSQVGFFDERIGPGQSGMSEDVEFAQRLRGSGGRIGYEPKAVVYHEVDWSRLTAKYFRLRHEQQGRSRFIYKKASFFSIIHNLMRSVITFGWYLLIRNERKKYRAKGRYYHYAAMLSEKFKVIRGIQV